MRHIAFPNIDQFRNTVKQVRDRASYDLRPLPKITFEGTVKLHGTNAAICSFYNPVDRNIWVQSRSNIITPESDNAGFASFVESRKDVFTNMFVCMNEVLRLQGKNFNDDDVISIYGEWCGSGIQKGVALSQLPKMFVVFAVSVSNIDDEGNVQYRWMTRDFVDSIFDISKTDESIKNIYDFDTWEIEIDFDKPEIVQNELGRFTEEVERRCPVGAKLGSEGIGEGIVWRAVECDDEDFKINNLIFKVKGEKHSITRVKTLASVDVEKVNNINEFVESVLTEARLNQGVQVLKEQGLEPSIENTGAFLKWIGGDVIKEESDTMEENGLDRKEVMPVINRQARQWFMQLKQF